MTDRVTTLKTNSIGLIEAVVQSGADIAPAVAVVTSGVFIVSLAGLASPLSMLFGTIVALALAKVIADFAKKIRTSGAFYTFMTKAFGFKTGFVIGMLLFLAYVLLLLFQMSFFGQFLNGILSVHISWEIYAIALIAVNTALAASGIAPSLRVGLIGLVFETVVFLVLALLIVFQGGAHGNTLVVFKPSEAPSLSGLMLGIIFGIFVFVGFESSTTLGEEMRVPHRDIPRALYLTVACIGVFVVLVIYSMIIGFGATPQGLAALQHDSTPFSTLALRYGNSTLQVFINLATVTSFLALNLIMVIASSRMMYSISRDGLLPRWLAKVNRTKTPSIAAIVVGGTSLVIVLITGTIFGALNVSNWYAFLSTLFFIAAYVVACVGIPIFYRRFYPEEFSIVGQILIPLVALVGMGAVLYGNLHPFPPAPLSYFPFITLAIIGLLTLWAFYLQRTSPEKVANAGQIFDAQPDAEVQAIATGTGAGDTE
jgi:amino acid transporter